MKNIFKRISMLFMALIMLVLTACSVSVTTDNGQTDASVPVVSESATKAKEAGSTAKTESNKTENNKTEKANKVSVKENGTYSSKAEVAAYIHAYNKLPSNYITKSEAQKLGWTGGSLEKYAKGKSIGGDKFGNAEGRLPKAGGRQYYECDIDTAGAKSRGAKRIVYSSDGLIFYTEDHYETFEQLY